MRIVFLGAPGVGKGTQAELLCRSKEWKHLASGDLLREAVEKQTPLGLKAKETMARGDLVEDSVLLGLIKEALDGIGSSGFVLDGYPRTVAQARALEEMFEERSMSVDRVILLVASKDEVISRLGGRGREDDSLETVQHRIKVYEDMTLPLIEFYEGKGLLSRVDGMGDIQAIHRRIVAALEE